MAYNQDSFVNDGDGIREIYGGGMMWQWWLFAATLTVATVMMIVRYRLKKSRTEWARATVLFRHRRELLEARFVTQASESGKPRGLVWCDCDFDDEVTFARDRLERNLQALIALTIRFEAEIGGGMEEVDAVHRLRAATAVFSFDGKDWKTDGRVVFNLSPNETIRHFRNELEAVNLR